MASPARFCSVFLKRIRERGSERERERERRGEGSGCTNWVWVRPLCMLAAWRAGLMRKPIRREEEGRGREGRRKGAAKAQLFSY